MTQDEFFKLAEKARKYGQSLVDDFAYDNLQMNLNLAQREQALDALQGVLHALQVGSVDIALARLSALSLIGLDGIIDQARKDKYVAKLQNLIGAL